MLPGNHLEASHLFSTINYELINHEDSKQFFYCTSNLPVYLFKIMVIQKWLITKDERTDIQTLGLSGVLYIFVSVY